MHRRNARRHRNHQRGAALLEGLILVPVFIVAFVGLLFAHRYYADTARATGLARQKAWTAARGGCTSDAVELMNGDSFFNEVKSNQLERGASPVTELPSEGRNLDGADATKITSRKAKVVETASGSASTPLLAAFEASHQVTSIVACNEVPEDGDIFAAVKSAFNQLTRW
jgi:hypothetical protein